MNLEPFSGSGSTPSRRRFWDKVTQAVNASQKIAGTNVSISEHPGQGSVINVADRCCKGGQVCFNLDVSATLSGTAIITGIACSTCSPADVSGSISGPGTTYCCDSGNPVLDGCSDCECVFNLQSDTRTGGGCGGLCVQEPNWSVYVELDLVSGSYELFVSGQCGTNLGNPPDCAGVCSIANDSGNTYSLGSDPTGTHVIDFTGGFTGATYHFEITIS